MGYPAILLSNCFELTSLLAMLSTVSHVDNKDLVSLTHPERC